MRAAVGVDGEGIRCARVDRFLASQDCTWFLMSCRFCYATFNLLYKTQGAANVRAYSITYAFLWSNNFSRS